VVGAVAGPGDQRVVCGTPFERKDTPHSDRVGGIGTEAVDRFRRKGNQLPLAEQADGGPDPVAGIRCESCFGPCGGSSEVFTVA